MTFFRHIVILLLCAAGLASCKSVYYNTFYNAKQSYQYAEQKRKESETPGSRLTPAVYYELYKRAIAKASAVLELYPKSKWVDDALLLIGKSFYWREEYRDALIKYQEIQENFPTSDLIAETIYWQGLTLWAMDRYEEARYSFSVIDEKTDPELFGLANLALAEMEASSENYKSAIDAYLSLIAQLGKKHKLLAHAWQGVGNCYHALGQYDKALEAYQNVLKSGPDTDINFETRIQIGTTLEQQGKFDEALAAYDRILQIKRLRIYEADAQIKQANVYRLKGEIPVAEETYTNLTKKYPRSKYSAEAYYRLGLISQQVHKDLEAAKDLFDKASREDRMSDAGQTALQRRKDIMLLERYRLQAADAKDPKKAIVPLFDLAELYLFNLGELDSALATYQYALSLADTTVYAPKALYAIGLIYADSLKNQQAARETFEKLVENYPNTPYANDARVRIQHQRADDALAEARFLEAEDLKQEGAPPEDYVPLLKQIATEYPQSQYAPQALFAIAWVYENDLGRLDDAKSVYQQVKDHYPLTRFGEVAEEKLAGDFLTPPPTNVDTTSVPAEVKTPPAPETPPVVATPDTSSAVFTIAEVDTPPELLEARPPAYPKSEISKGRPITVTVRLLILPDGKIEKADVVSGPEDFHSAAILAAVKYRFKPALKSGKPCRVWMELPILFEPPE